jgi:hypothetical protein
MFKLKSNISDSDVNTAVKKAEKGLEQYTQIISLLPKIDVSKDIAFQKEYKVFYKFMFLDENFVTDYFSFLQENKNGSPDFIDTLKYFQEKYDKFFYSYVSKLLATIDPNLPVWDTPVCFLLNFKNPDSELSDKRKISKAKEIYELLAEWYNYFIPSEEGRKWINLFDNEYPNSNITSVKKIDLIIWGLSGIYLKKAKEGDK